MQALTDAGSDLAPVLERGEIVGLVTARGILRAYRAAAHRAAPA